MTQEDGAGGDGGEGDGLPSRRSLACVAYPDLVPKARRFRDAMWWISAILLIWLLVTCLLSWYVALGNAALGDLATANANLAAAQKTVRDLESGTPPATAGRTAVSQTPPQQIRPLCQPGPKKSPPSYASFEQMHACEVLRQAQEKVDRLNKKTDRWAMVFGDADTAAWWANLLGSAVLPVFYGFLGAGAAIVRSLSRKIKGSLLAPRDFHLSVQQLALGAVVGACIGLFIAQPESGSGGEAALLGPVALSGSAISFVAGFGVEAVFQALEALISRIFNIAPVSSPARPDGPPAN